MIHSMRDLLACFDIEVTALDLRSIWITNPSEKEEKENIILPRA